MGSHEGKIKAQLDAFIHSNEDTLLNIKNNAARISYMEEKVKENSKVIEANHSKMSSNQQ
jgi:hypothetical protein